MGRKPKPPRVTLEKKARNQKTAALVRSALDELDLTQEGLAVKMGVEQRSTIGKWAAAIDAPSAANILRIQELLRSKGKAEGGDVPSEYHQPEDDMEKALLEYFRQLPVDVRALKLLEMKKAAEEHTSSQDSTAHLKA